jgi:hypothetical protein
MSTTLLPAGQSLVDEIARRIGEAGCPASDCVVIFPGKRPAHFLRQRLAATAGSSILPPRMLSMDELVDAAYEERAARDGQVRPKLDPIDAVSILYEIQIASQHPLGGNAFMTLDSFFSVGLKVFNDIEELLIEEVPARNVAEVQVLVEEKVPPRSRERLQTLAVFYETFYEQVKERGFSTRSSRYRAVASTVLADDVPRQGPIILAGFFTLTRAEHRLFTAMASWPRVQMVFQDGPGICDRIQGLGIPPVAGRPDKPAPRPTMHFYSSPDTHGQIFALSAALTEAEESTLIVLPKPETLFPLLRHCLSRFDPESYNVSLPYPLQRTPLYGFLNDLMELVATMDGERVYLPSYVSFVLHPYVKNIRLGASAESTRVLFHALEESLASQRTRRFATLEEIESDTGLFAVAAKRIGDEQVSGEMLRAHLTDIHERTVSRFRSFRNVRDFAERCIELISWVHDESTARDHPYFTPFSERFVQSLEAISRSLMAEKSFNDTGSYFILLRRYIQTCYLPFPGTPLHGMQVLGALETRNLQFKRVFVLDANEGSFPGTGSENTLLPLPVRLALKLSTYRDQEDIAAYHFSLLTAGAAELHLFSLSSGESERSRFVERLLWEEQKKSGTLSERGIVQPIQYRVNLSTAQPAAVEKTPAMAEWLRSQKYSATSLDAYLQCPLKFYYRSVLALGPREETTGEIEAVDIGSFVHDVLKRYFTARTGRPLGAEDADRGEMATLVDDAFSRWFGAADTGANRLLRAQVRRHLGDFLDGYLKELVAAHRITFKALERPIETAWGDHALRGRLDVVADRDGKPCLIDYKTSAHRANYALRMDRLDIDDRATWSRAIPTLQLPFYMLLYAAESGREPAEVQAMFLLLGRTQMDDRIEVPLFEDPSDAVDAWPRLETVIRRLLEEIVSPEIPFTPAPDLRAACPRCDFAAICGTAWLKKG